MLIQRVESYHIWTHSRVLKELYWCSRKRDSFTFFSLQSGPCITCNIPQLLTVLVDVLIYRARTSTLFWKMGKAKVPDLGLQSGSRQINRGYHGGYIHLFYSLWLMHSMSQTAAKLYFQVALSCLCSGGEVDSNSRVMLGFGLTSERETERNGQSHIHHDRP